MLVGLHDYNTTCKARKRTLILSTIMNMHRHHGSTKSLIKVCTWEQVVFNPTLGIFLLGQHERGIITTFISTQGKLL